MRLGVGVGEEGLEREEVRMLQGDEDKEAEERTRGALERFEPGPAALEQPRALRTPQADHHYPTTRCRRSLAISRSLAFSLALSLRDHGLALTRVYAHVSTTR